MSYFPVDIILSLRNKKSFSTVIVYYQQKQNRKKLFKKVVKESCELAAVYLASLLCVFLYDKFWHKINHFLLLGISLIYKHVKDITYVHIFIAPIKLK